MNGFAEIEIGGKIRPIKFGTNQTAIFCQFRKINLAQFSELFSSERLSNKDIDGSEIRDLIYSALVAGCRTKKIDQDFDETEVGDWIDELEQSELDNIFEVYMQSLPNVKGAKKKMRKAA